MVESSFRYTQEPVVEMKSKVEGQKRAAIVLHLCNYFLITEEAFDFKQNKTINAGTKPLTKLFSLNFDFCVLNAYNIK